MLKEYVSDGTVDYGRWQKEAVGELQQWLNDVRQVDIEGLEAAAAIAFFINLYNALTIQQVLQKYPIDSIRPKVLGIPNWPSFLAFFKKEIYTLGDTPKAWHGRRALSLDSIEHDILRERYREPRIHFALVCASTGCPLIRGNAYVPEKLDMQLEEDARRFINNPDKVKYDASSKILYCSKIFKWYESDFLTQAASVPSYIQKYTTNPNFDVNPDIEYLPYDWSLNQRTSS